MNTLAKVLNLALLVASTSAMASTFECTGGNFDPVKVKVLSGKKVLINGSDVGNVDTAYAAANPEKKYLKLKGNFESLGDGVEGYLVDVTITKYFFFENSKIAFLNTYNRGPGGYYTDSYKCVRVNN